MKTTAIIIGLIFFALITFVGCERVNVGNVGLQVNLSGSERGVSKMKYVTGFCFYNRFSTTIVEYSTRFASIEFSDFAVTCKGGTTFTAHPKLTYKVNASLADKTYQSFGTDDMSIIEQGYIHNAVTKALGDVANKFTPDSLLYSRERYEDMVMKDVKYQCDSLGIDITMFRANLTPSEAISAAIDAKQKAIQDAQKVENEKMSTIAEGEKLVAKAKLEAEALITSARAEAESNKLRQQTLTPMLLQQQFLEKWDGKLPVYGNTPQLFKDISK